MIVSQTNIIKTKNWNNLINNDKILRLLILSDKLIKYTT